jgi:hypothetical protein
MKHESWTITDAVQEQSRLLIPEDRGVPQGERSADGISSAQESALETTFWPQGPPVRGRPSAALVSRKTIRPRGACAPTRRTPSGGGYSVSSRSKVCNAWLKNTGLVRS